MPKISVIIPIYNVEKYLRQCLDSVVNQTLSDIEIICINDGSTDNSADILSEYTSEDGRFVILNQQNQGVSVSRNNGLDIANGKYVAFIDSDDYLLNGDYFEKMYNACESYDADIAVASIIRGNDKKSSYILKIEKEEVTVDYEKKLIICDVPNSNYVWNKLYRRVALLDTGIIFPPEVYYEDLYFTHKVLYYMSKLVSVPGVANFYRKRPGSIVKTKNKSADIDYKNGNKMIQAFFKEHGVTKPVKVTKKYKFLGVTVFKKIQEGQKCKNSLLNLLSWYTYASN